MLKIFNFVFASGALVTLSVGAQDFDLQSYLRNLDRDPYNVMSQNQPLARRVTTRDGKWKAPSAMQSLMEFQESQILESKRQMREKILEKNMKPFSSPVAYDQASDIVDRRDAQGNPITLKSDMESLDSWKEFYFESEQAPWSGDYWATYKGLAAARYSDSSFMSINNWRRAREYSLQTNPASELVRQRIQGQLSDESIDQMAPTEKYELLVGDSTHALTRYNWSWGEGLQGPDGNIEDWMGICDGWASAAIMLPRPKNKITLKALDHDLPLTFYPADLMALASYLWAERAPEVKFIGGRCNSKEPKRDPESGRLLDEDCFNNNPATWHMAVLNQLNQAKRSMILDVFFDYEVWNQPISGYRLRYFNPKTGETVNTLEEARVAYAEMGVENARKDIFAKFRNTSSFTHLVGVQMDLTYVGEIDPTRLSPFTPASDYHETLSLVYDLELRYTLDSEGKITGSGEIVGGEWYSGKHPDFLWVPYVNSVARGYQESTLIGSWGLEQERLPREWKNAAVYNTSNGTPMNKILRSLIERSRQ